MYFTELFFLSLCLTMHGYPEISFWIAVTFAVEKYVCNKAPSFKVHLTPNLFLRLNKFLHLFETHWAFLLLFLNQILTFYRL